MTGTGTQSGGGASAAALWPGMLAYGYVLVALNLWIFFFVTHLVGPRITPSFHDQQRILQVVVLVIVGVLILARPVRDGLYETYLHLPRLARLSLGLLLVLGVVSSSVAVQPLAAIREVGLFVLLALLCLLVTTAHRVESQRFEHTALRLLVAGAATYAIVFAILDLAVDRSSTMFGFSHPRFAGQAALWLFPLLVVAAGGRHGRPAVRAGRWFVVIAWWALLLESGSRAALLGSLLGLAVAATVGRRQAIRWLGGYASAVAAGTALWFAWIRLLGGGTGGLDRVVEEAGADRGRLTIWPEALRLGIDRPLLGVGPEHYAYHSVRPEGHPHSAPVQFVAEWGLPATLLVAFLAIWALTAWLAACHARTARGADRKSPGADVDAALTAALVAGAAASLVDGVLVMPVSQMLMVGAVGWALGRMRDREPTREQGRWGGVVVAVGGLVAGGVLLAGAWEYGTQPVRQLDAYAEEHPDRPLTPRFWQVGRLDR